MQYARDALLLQSFHLPYNPTMKKILFFLMLALGVQLNPVLSQTNDFYDDAPLSGLKMSELYIDGEIENPGKVDFQALPLRQVVVKEAAFNGDKGSFTGAYLYEGYSVYDILNQVVLKKKNEAEFPPIVDLYVEVENAAGEKVVLSWGEIYYPVHRHEILIASGVRRIVPSKTKDLWPLPADSKLVVASDLFTERNISNPVRITVRSCSLSFKIDRDIPDMYAGTLNIFRGSELLAQLKDPGVPEGTMENFRTVFYGRGRGIHGITTFKGVMLKEYAAGFFPESVKNLRTGLFVASAPDGYRAVFTYSEVFNRNDQAEVLIVPMHDVKSEGAYGLFPAADFFSDRSIRCLNEIKFLDAAGL